MQTGPHEASSSLGQHQFDILELSLKLETVIVTHCASNAKQLNKPAYYSKLQICLQLDNCHHNPAGYPSSNKAEGSVSKTELLSLVESIISTASAPCDVCCSWLLTLGC
jgi:hypothetical protein